MFACCPVGGSPKIIPAYWAIWEVVNALNWAKVTNSTWNPAARTAAASYEEFPFLTVGESTRALPLCAKAVATKQHMQRELSCVACVKLLFFVLTLVKRYSETTISTVYLFFCFTCHINVNIYLLNMTFPKTIMTLDEKLLYSCTKTFRSHLVSN